MSNTLLELSQVERVFERRTGLFSPPHRQPAVDGVDLALGVGERLGVVGESGCGKSTLARLILGLTRPTSGSIRFEGVDHARRSGGDWRRFRARTGFVQQDPASALDPQMKIGAQVAEPVEVHEKTGRMAALQRAGDALVRVGLDRSMLDRYPHQLSGGQRQRVVIARALVLSPQLVVFDEAVSALDVSVQAQVIAIINRLHAELDLTYLFISHDLRVVRHTCSRVAVMYLGRIVEMAPVRELFRAPAHPYTKALLGALPRLEPGTRTRRATVAGEARIAGSGGCRFRFRCPIAVERCASEDPVLRAMGAGQVACHRAEESQLQGMPS